MPTPEISILTPTVRKAGLNMVVKAIKNQTFKNYEWLIGSPFDPDIEEAIWVKDDFPVGIEVWSLNRIYNKMLRHAKGRLVVSIQDFTYAKPDTLEKFWFHYQQDHKNIVSAIGNKYSDDSWIVETWHDPREKGVSFHKVPFNEIEFNLCAVPKKAFFDVGGYDEWLDKYYGMDGFSVVDRINMIGGYEFYLDETIKSYSLEHGRLKDWDKKNALGDIYNSRRTFYFEKPHLKYLI
jgi:hypothetical protein